MVIKTYRGTFCSVLNVYQEVNKVAKHDIQKIDQSLKYQRFLSHNVNNINILNHLSIFFTDSGISQS